MKLLLGFVLGLIVATASSLSANDFGSWSNPSTGQAGTYWNGPLGTQYNDLTTGQSGLITTQPMGFGGKQPC